MASPDDQLDGSVIFYICTSDISIVQGNTEHFHVANHFNDLSIAHLFGPIKNTREWEHVHQHPFSGVLGVLLLNIVFLPYWFYMTLKLDPDVVYCYQNVILPPFLIQWLSGATIVYDIQSGPVSQATEFSDREDRGALFRLLNVFNKYGHQFALSRSDVVVTLSEPLKKQLCISYHLDVEKVNVVPLGVDTDRFTPTQKENSIVRIVYLGTASATRGLEKISNALDSLDSNLQSNVQFEIYGSGDKSYVQTLRPDADSAWEFTWHGYVDYDEIPGVVSKCDIAVSPLPGYESYEVSSPAKVFEYLSMGLPVVATSLSAHERILADGEDSLLVDPNSEAEMEDALRRMIKDDNLRHSLGSKARENSLDHDWEQRFALIKQAIVERDK